MRMLSCESSPIKTEFFGQSTCASQHPAKQVIDSSLPVKPHLCLKEEIFNPLLSDHTTNEGIHGSLTELKRSVRPDEAPTSCTEKSKDVEHRDIAGAQALDQVQRDLAGQTASGWLPMTDESTGRYAASVR
jgi:hypothetical protein